ASFADSARGAAAARLVEPRPRAPRPFGVTRRRLLVAGDRRDHRAASRSTSAAALSRSLESRAAVARGAGRTSRIRRGDAEMNCRNLNSVLDSQALEELSFAQRRDIERHLASCRECREAWAIYR